MSSTRVEPLPSVPNISESYGTTARMSLGSSELNITCLMFRLTFVLKVSSPSSYIGAFLFLIETSLPERDVSPSLGGQILVYCEIALKWLMTD